MMDDLELVIRKSSPLFQWFVECVSEHASEGGLSREELRAIFQAEGLLLAAQMHRGSREAFIQSACDAFALIETGSVEQ